MTQTDERLISRSLTQEETEGFLQALEGASFQRVEQVGYSPWEPYYYLGFTKENGSQGCIVRGVSRRAWSVSSTEGRAAAAPMK